LVFLRNVEKIVQTVLVAPYADCWVWKVNNGTLVIDIKPVMSEFLPRGEVKQPDWFRQLMQDYWKKETP
jgi:tRNA (Thr-GGU) A37 N-methylase